MLWMSFWRIFADRPRALPAADFFFDNIFYAGMQKSEFFVAPADKIWKPIVSQGNLDGKKRIRVAMSSWIAARHCSNRVYADRQIACQDLGSTVWLHPHWQASSSLGRPPRMYVIPCQEAHWHVKAWSVLCMQDGNVKGMHCLGSAVKSASKHLQNQKEVWWRNSMVWCFLLLFQIMGKLEKNSLFAKLDWIRVLKFPEGVHVCACVLHRVG